MMLPHAVVDTPVFMPVGTQGTLKGLTSDQLDELGCRIILGNTYHLGNRPVRKSYTSSSSIACTNSVLSNIVPRSSDHVWRMLYITKVPTSNDKMCRASE